MDKVEQLIEFLLGVVGNLLFLSFTLFIICCLLKASIYIWTLL